MSSENANKGEDCLGWAARDESGVLSPYKFARRAVGSDDVSIKITHCGVCYAEVVWTRNKHGDATYPLVPGHEIAGIVQEVGSNVCGFKVGDHVGVGTYINSCRNCDYCNDGLEVYCEKEVVYTYNRLDVNGTMTKGGFSTYIVVRERYCFRIAESYPLASAAPLLCAGITVYSPMIRHKMNQPGKSLGVIGLGGLGHLAVKFDNFVVSSDQEQMKAMAKSLDFIIDTVSADHSFDMYMSLLKTAGVLVMVGAPNEVKLSPMSLILGMKSISGSVAGGTKEMQEMLNFCAAQKIYPNIEIVPIQYVNEAIERLIKKDVKYRFVVDIENSLKY
ncbi:probable cinnamyl alcohol dehydrogenase 1 isoform X2 [Pyrus x bretschneideri]|uniref:probable cinnamyl alcohol dehydrogenase 1 isoform X2 n=1 Tax=Pyrus x bretschneideri TaxID=225117 RepID=UPI0020303AFE|nr:probable cinnamyl alcohol dehydrogenase 1 isoform X2 [Pyrus x bretschneideri]